MLQFTLLINDNAERQISMNLRYIWDIAGLTSCIHLVYQV